jgi:hypothetical protein
MKEVMHSAGVHSSVVQPEFVTKAVFLRMQADAVDQAQAFMCSDPCATNDDCAKMVCCTPNADADEVLLKQRKNVVTASDGHDHGHSHGGGQSTSV